MSESRPSGQETPTSARSIAVLFRVICVIRGSPCYSLSQYSLRTGTERVVGGGRGRLTRRRLGGGTKRIRARRISGLLLRRRRFRGHSTKRIGTEGIAGRFLSGRRSSGRVDAEGVVRFRYRLLWSLARRFPLGTGRSRLLFLQTAVVDQRPGLPALMQALNQALAGADDNAIGLLVDEREIQGLSRYGSQQPAAGLSRTARPFRASRQYNRSRLAATN